MSVMPEARGLKVQSSWDLWGGHQQFASCQDGLGKHVLGGPEADAFRGREVKSQAGIFWSRFLISEAHGCMLGLRALCGMTLCP